MGAVAVMGALTVATSLLQAKQEMQAGQDEAYAMKMEDKNMKIQSIGDEADRKYKLARGLASQVAGAGAGNIQMSGSPLATMMEDVSQEKKDTERADFNRKIQHRTSRRNQRNTKDASYWKAGTGLLSSGKDLVGVMK